MSAVRTLNTVQTRLTECGFDVAVPFVVHELEALLNSDVGSGDRELLFSFGVAPDEDAAGIVVGNSRALWPVFHGTLGTSAAEQEHPLDAYTERAVRSAVEGIQRTKILFGHGQAGSELPLQRIAHHTGYLPLSPGRLNVHPVLGPWLALRGVIVLPGVSLPPELLLRQNDVCRGCGAPCHGALELALSSAPGPRRPELTHLGLSERAERFLAVRTVCPVGQAERYPDAQIQFHYGRLA